MNRVQQGVFLTLRQSAFSSKLQTSEGTDIVLLMQITTLFEDVREILKDPVMQNSRIFL